jgi:hypothetical protein
MPIKQNITSLNSEVTITVFQALTLLMKKYRNSTKHQLRYDTIESLYLSGTRDENDLGVLDALLDDEVLAGYTVNSSKHAINNDPVRRYFESHLCHETLNASLDSLDSTLLEKHLASVIALFQKEDQVVMQHILHEESPVSTTALDETTSTIYTESVRTLSRADSCQSFKPAESAGRKSPEERLDIRKNKMKLIMQSMYASMHALERLAPEKEAGLSNLYYKPNSLYSARHRGRKGRRDPSTGQLQSVQADKMGIMRSFMPLATDDALRAESPSNHTRAADVFSDKRGLSHIPNVMFFTKVTPFVGSISGTMLVNLSVMSRLLRDDQLVYQNNESQLNLFFTLSMAYFLHHTGGHSLDEYFMVLDLPEAQEELQTLVGFSSLSLDKLFKHDNRTAFDKAVEQTIAYNDAILTKRTLHTELKLEQHLKTIFEERKAPKPLPGAVGTVSFSFPEQTESYAVADRSFISATLLFACVHLLNQKSPKRWSQDLFHRTHELFLVVSMLSFVHMFGSKFVKTHSSESMKSNRKDTPYAAAPLVGKITHALLNYSITGTADNVQEKADKPTHRITL